MLYRNYFTLLLAVLCLMLTTGDMLAQRASLENVNRAYFRKCGTIRNETGITGYYLFTRQVKTKMTGKKRNKPTDTYSYLLTIMDQDLNTIGEKRFPDKPGLAVRDVSYNGTYLAVKMVNSETEKKWIELFDGEGNSIRRKGLRYGAYDDPKLYANMAIFDLNHLIPVNGGFLNFDFSTGDKGKLARSMYSVNFVSNDPEDRGWTTKSSRNSKDYEGASFVAANDSLVVINVWKRPNMLSQKMSSEMIGVNLVTGRRAFRWVPKEDDLSVRWFAGAFKNGEMIATGVDMGKSAKLYTGEPEGIDLLRLSPDGETLQRERIVLGTDLDPYLKTSDGGKVAGMGNLYVHDVGMSETGELLVAGEFYKTFNGGLTARDGIVMQVGADFKLKGVSVVEKGKTNDGKGLGMTLAGGITLASKSTVAAIGVINGTFDFAFLEAADDVVSAAYFSGRKQVKEDKKLSLYVNTLLDGQIRQDKFSFDAKSSLVRTLPAKPGYVMVLEYNGETKELDIHLERLNL